MNIGNATNIHIANHIMAAVIICDDNKNITRGISNNNDNDGSERWLIGVNTFEWYVGALFNTL